MNLCQHSIVKRRSKHELAAITALAAGIIATAIICLALPNNFASAATPSATFTLSTLWTFPGYSGTVWSDNGHAGNYTPSSATYHVLQGGTTDGTSVYYVRTVDVTQAGGKKFTYTVLMRVRLSDGLGTISHAYPVRTDSKGKRVVTSLLGHGNDLVHKSNTGNLAAPGWAGDDTTDPDGANMDKRMKVFKPSLEYDKARDFQKDFTAICWNQTKKQYVTRNGTSLSFHDDGTYALKSTKSISRALSGSLYQGIDCNDNYVFVLESKANQAAVSVFDWTGNLKKIWTVANAGGEVEHIFHKNSTFYIGVNNVTNSSDVLRKVNVSLNP